MVLVNLANRQIISEYLSKNIQEVQIKSCTLDDSKFYNKIWQNTSIYNSNVNNTIFNTVSLKNTTFYHSSLMNTVFNSCNFSDTVFSGDTLIKTQWLNCHINSISITQSTMQNLKIKKCIIRSSNFSDFEGIYGIVENSIFYECSFSVTLEYGMNGFSNGKFINCIFINCSFKGFPLRGANTEFCTFIHCSGEITDDAECSNTVGLDQYCRDFDKMQIKNRQKALDFINRWK